MVRALLYSAIALLTAGMGAFMMLHSLGLVGTAASTAEAPAWLGVAAGFVFFAGGACVLLKAGYGDLDSGQGGLPDGAPAPVRFLYNALGISIVIGLGALFTWVALGPGDREFSGSGAIFGPAVGRAMFGLAAVLTWLFLGWSAVRWIKRQRE